MSLSVSDNDKKSASCPCCGRHVPLTFHHLIPRKLHRRNGFKKRFSRVELNKGVYICRMCHDGIHRQYDEMTLAKTYATLANIQSDTALARHFQWVAKQKAPRSR